MGIGTSTASSLLHLQSSGSTRLTIDSGAGSASTIYMRVSGTKKHCLELPVVLVMVLQELPQGTLFAQPKQHFAFCQRRQHYSLNDSRQ